MKTFGELIRYKRKELGYSQLFVETKLNLGRNCLYKYELNKNIPSLLRIKKISDFYLLDFEEMCKLIYGDDFKLTYGGILKLKRQEIGLSLEQASSKINISPRNLQYCETEKIIPNTYIDKLCSLYNLDKDELIICVHNIDIKTFGGRIKLERIKKCLGKKDVANRLNISTSNIRGYENNSVTPKYNIIKEISDYLDIDFIELLNLAHPIKTNKFGDLIRSLRKRRNLSLAEVANKIVMDKSSLYLIESNENKPNISSIRKICNFYNINIIDIMKTYFSSTEDNSLGSELRIKRIESNLTIKEVSELLNIDGSRLYRYESNKVIPSEYTLEKLNSIYRK